MNKESVNEFPKHWQEIADTVIKGYDPKGSFEYDENNIVPTYDLDTVGEMICVGIERYAAQPTPSNESIEQMAERMKCMKAKLNKEIEKIKDEFNSLNDQRIYSTGSYLQTKISTLKDVLKWLDEITGAALVEMHHTAEGEGMEADDLADLLDFAALNYKLQVTKTNETVWHEDSSAWYTSNEVVERWKELNYESPDKRETAQGMKPFRREDGTF